MARAIRYVGFWERLLNFLIIDTVIILLLLTPFYLLFKYTNASEIPQVIKVIVVLFVANIPLIYTISFLRIKKATPSMMVTNQQLVDKKSHSNLSVPRLFIRYLLSYISFFSFGLGYLWIIFDNKNRTWHDILTGAIMIYPRAEATQDLTFARKMVARAHDIPVSSLKSKEDPISPIEKL